MEEDITKEQNEKLIESENKYKYLYAEFENYKKRVQREKEEIQNSTMIKTLASIFDVDNDISIALNNVKDKDSREGIKLISQKIQAFLKTHGIETIQTDTYDSELHDVVNVIGGGKKIKEVISKGYTLNGKPFRFPKVILG